MGVRVGASRAGKSFIIRYEGDEGSWEEPGAGLRWLV